MELKKLKQKNILSRLGSRLHKNKPYAFVIIIYNFSLIMLAILVFYLLPQELQNKVTRNIPSKKILFKKLNNKLNSTKPIDELKIDIKHKNYQKLAYVRALSLKKGFLQENLIENKVPGTIQYNSKTYKADFSLKGSLPSHWAAEKMWSMKIRLKGEKTILGMKEFAIQHPKERGFLNEWILHKLFKYVDIIGLRYGFISVNVNGKGSNIYAYEEKFDKRLIENASLKEGPIFKFNGDYNWGKANGLTPVFWGAEVIPFSQKKIIQDSTSYRLFIKARSLMEAFRRNEMITSSVFDLNKLASFFAVIDLMGHHHASDVLNLRFYYNPITSLIEPIGYDNEVIFPLTKQGLLGENKTIGDSIKHYPPIPWWKNTAWYENVFKDKFFYKEYIRVLNKIAAPNFLDSFFLEINEELERNKHVLHSIHPLYEFTEQNILYENANYIRKELNTTKLVQPYFLKQENEKIILSVKNLMNLPVETLFLEVGDSLKLPPLIENIIQSRKKLSPIEDVNIVYDLPKSFIWTDSLKNNLTLNVRILGNDNAVREKVIPWPLHPEKALISDLMRSKSNTQEFDFISVDDNKRLINFQTGKHQINKHLIIPKGYHVIIQEGTRIDMINEANMISYSPLYLRGDEEHPILITSSDSTSQGIIVMNAENTSSLTFVYFDNLSNPNYAGWELTGAVNFYQSPVEINHCIFANNRKGDDYLNIVRTNYKINHSTFINIGADALDGDFSDGKINNTKFINIGNDGIDVSGSNLLLNDVEIENVLDKGISAGENSYITGNNIKIHQTEMAIVSKDLSRIDFGNVIIRDCKIGFSAFQKKPEFGPATINISNNSTLLGDLEIAYLIEDKSHLFIQGKAIQSSLTIDNVKKILYGVKYGRSSNQK